MFRTVPLSIISTFSLYAQQWYMSYSLRSASTPLPFLQEAGWVPGPVWTGGKSRLHRDSIPDRPTHSQSLYRLSYPGPLKSLCYDLKLEYIDIASRIFVDEMSVLVFNDIRTGLVIYINIIANYSVWGRGKVVAAWSQTLTLSSTNIVTPSCRESMCLTR